MKAKDLKNLSQEELLAKLKSFKQDLFKINQQRFSAGSVDKPHMFSLIRKYIARINTILSENKREK